MTLRNRLAKLEAQRPSAEAGPRILMHSIVWRTEEGRLNEIAAFARVLTPSGWQTITRAEGEAEADFHLRADAMACIQPAAGEWVLAELRKKQSPA